MRGSTRRRHGSTSREDSLGFHRDDNESYSGIETADSIYSIYKSESDPARESSDVIPSYIDADPRFPFTQSMGDIPCQTSGYWIPHWHANKHSETHAEVQECNESILVLRNTIRELKAVFRVQNSTSSARRLAEYRGMPFFPWHFPIVTRFLSTTDDIRTRDMTPHWVITVRRILDETDAILREVLNIDNPTEGLQHNLHNLISRSRQQEHIGRIGDAALNQLLFDAERIVTQKVDRVLSVYHTIRNRQRMYQPSLLLNINH